MSDFCKQLVAQKRRDAFKIFKPSGPTAGDERAQREKAIDMAIDVLSTSASKLIEYGVPEDQAYSMIFSLFPDKTLLLMIQAVAHTLWKKANPK